jgi:hypothetical protein
MFTVSRQTQPTALDLVLEKLFIALDDLTPGTKEYSAVADEVSKLYELKKIDSSRRVSPDTIAVIVANLAGIAIIIGHERLHVIATKAFSMITKLK